MRSRVRSCARGALWALLVASVPAAHAQVAVIDPAAISQLAMQLLSIEREVAMAVAQYQALTGGRGMQLLLAGTHRNYLPPDWPTLVATEQGTSSYSGLYLSMQSAQQADALLSAQQLASLPPAGSQALLAQRQSVALQQAITRAALANSSSRFGALQGLVTAIGTAGDSKASMDLNARIGAEQGMLENEQTKLLVLHQVGVAERWADEQRLRELVVAAHGSFATRFQPSP